MASLGSALVLLLTTLSTIFSHANEAVSDERLGALSEVQVLDLGASDDVSSLVWADAPALPELALVPLVALKKLAKEPRCPQQLRARANITLITGAHEGLLFDARCVPKLLAVDPRLYITMAGAVEEFLIHSVCYNAGFRLAQLSSFYSDFPAAPLKRTQRNPYGAASAGQG